MDNLFYFETETIGKITIVENGKAINHVYFGELAAKKENIKETALLKEAGKQLEEYFLGIRKIFDLPAEPKGTDFQKKVWNELLKIPYGKTCSYKDIAIGIGNKNACRAVGMANNRNPIPIIIPCHRVIGSDGKLVGYGGGLHIKEKLLRIEENLK